MSNRFYIYGFKHLLQSITLVACLLSTTVIAREAVPASDDPQLEARVQSIAVELRCLVCQNQTIADSHAELAIDLRNQIRDMLRAGKSTEEVTRYMTARYGDFVLYRPPLKSTTWALWFGPGLLLLGGFFALFIVLRRRSQLPAEEDDNVQTRVVDSDIK